MADTTIAGLARVLTTNTGAILPITIAGVTFGIPVSAIITASGDMGTDAFQLPVGTTAQRVSTALGSVRYNTNADAIEYYTTQGWVRPQTGVSPSYSITATGGTTYTYISGGKLFKVHAFTDTGASSFQVQSVYGSPVVEILVIGGGGGGGLSNGSTGGGGGGAGGLAYVSNYSVSTENYSVIVGSGGLGQTALPSTQSANPGFNGGDSSFSSILAKGGGGGGGTYPSWGNGAGVAGGSGGGASTDNVNRTGGASTQAASTGGATGYGFKGGDTDPYTSGGNRGSSGGGGAGGVGLNKSGNNAGGGGPGRAYDITGTNLIYSAGGGGGTTSGTQGSGGDISAGTGGNSSNLNGTNALANRGGGGGGSGSNGNPGVGGNGGSGIVVVRYQI